MRQWMGSALIDMAGFDNAIAAANAAIDLLRRQNLFIDGECQVAQGASKALTTAAQFGSVDMWAAWASGGVITSGTMTQSTALAGVSTQNAVAVASLTLTGAGSVSFRQRIESKRARMLVNQNASFSCVVRHGNAAAVPVVVVIRSANAADNFAATTVIYTSAAQSAAATPALTTISIPNVPMGACGNGIEVEVQMQVGACTNSFAQLADAQLVEGATVPTFLPTPFDVALSQVRRHFQKSFPYATAPAQGSGVQIGQFVRQCVVAGVATGETYMGFPVPMRTQPVMTFYNPISANANWRNYTANADSGAAAGTAIGEPGLGMTQTQVAGDAVGAICGVHWTADARL